jgi:hypothetical protein
MQKENHQMKSALTAMLTLTLVVNTALANDGASELDTARLQDLMPEALSYSHHSQFMHRIDHLYIGYDRSGEAIAAVAVDRFKGYEECTAIVLIVRKDNLFVIEKVLVPDLDNIKDSEKNARTRKAATDVVGHVVLDTSREHMKIHAVTGATRIQKRIYSSFESMAKMSAKAILENPDWERSSFSLQESKDEE